jgi:capsular exopolysaccharide synthesis family protein
MDAHHPKPPVDFVRLLRRVFAHRWHIVVAAFLVIAVPTIVLTIIATEDTYEASATLFVLPEKEKSDPTFMRDFMTPEVNALYQVVLRSRSLAQAVVETLPKESRDELSRRIGFRDYVLIAMNQVRRWRGEEVVVYSPTELAVRELQEARMSFTLGTKEGGPKDGTVTITATAFSPRVAVDLANTYVEVLLSRSSSFARQQARGTRELLESMLAQARTSQTEAEDSLRKFQAQGGGAVKLPDESRVDLQRLTKLETELSDAQVSLEIAQNRLAYLKGDRKSGAAGDPATQALRDRLAQLGAKLSLLNEKYTAQHPLVLAARAEMQDTQEQLKASLQPQQTPRPAGVTALKPLEAARLSKQMADLEVEIISLRTREQGLQQRIGRLKQSMASMGLREHEYAGLARSAETQSKLAGMLAEKLTAARMSEQTQIRGIQVIDLASLPKQPSAKRPLKLMLLGLLGGLGFGLGAATLREYTTQVIETEQEIAAGTGLAVLGSIPLAPFRPGSLASADTPTIFVATQDPHSLPADSCRAIRVAIDCQSLDHPLKTLLVTSPGAHEGKSTILANLALAFVESGRRVLVIDADLRRPALHRAFRVPNEGGLADMLQKGAAWPEGFHRVAPGLELLPSGIKPHNPGSLLSSRHMTKLLEEARERADLVLIDSPPVLAMADALPLAAHVDGVLLVTRFGATQRRSVVRAKDALEKVGAHLVGVVVNGLSPRETRRHYAEYEQYVSAGKPGRKKNRRGMKSLFTSLLIALTILGTGVAAVAAEDDYKIGTDDVLHVIVWDNKDLEQTVIVRPDGKISFPLAGEIQAKDLTVPQLTEALTRRLSTAVKNPNVSVMVKEIRSYRVHFVGRIAKPGVYPIKAGTPLLQALTLAGGPSENADLPAAYIIRDEKTIPIDLRKLIQDGDLSKNIKLEREDTIVVPEIATGSNPQEILDRRIYVLRKVAKPGVYTLKLDVPILHALFLAGGVAENGDLASAFVIRGKDKIPVDLWKLIQKGDLSQNVTIKHEDTIVIPAGGELQNAVYVMGEVNKPGVYSQPEALSLLKLVTLAGGFTKYAAPGRATLIRREGEKKVLMKVDLKDIMSDPKVNEDLSLRPGDVLIVPERLF